MQPPTAAPPPHPRGNATTPPGCPRDVVVTPPPRRHDEIMNEIGGWWDTKEARNIFAPTSPVGGTDIIVSLRIDLLDSVLTSKNVEKVVNKATECKLDDKHAVEIVYKCLYLRQAYQIALEKIATPQTTWKDCCREAIEKLANVGIKSITGWRTIQDYNLTFRMKQCFPHPSIRVELGRKYTPMLLD